MQIQRNLACVIEGTNFLLLALLFCLLPSVEIPDLWDFTQTGKFIVFSYAILGISVLSIFYFLFFFSQQQQQQKKGKEASYR